VESAYVVTETTVVSTSIARTVTTTTTIYGLSHTGSPTGGEPSSTIYSTSRLMISPSPVSSYTPIGEYYSCPADNNTTQTIAVNSQVYTYHVFCNSSFANETAFSMTSASSDGDCISLCSYADNLANGPICKGFSFDGISCALYTQALTSDLILTSGVDSAVLAVVEGPSNTTFANRTVEAAEVSSIAASITSGVTMITPPPQFSANATASTSCFLSTYTDTSDGEIFWTESCTWSSAWWASYASTTTIIYSSQTVLVESDSGANGAGGAGGAGVSGGASGPAGATVTLITATSTATSGLVSGGTAAGGATGPSVTTLTTLIQGSTYIIISTFAGSGSGSGSNVTGGAGGALSTGMALSGSVGGGTGTGGIITTLISTVTTIIGQSTSIYVTTYATGGLDSGGTGIGGVISPSTGPWNFSTTFYLSGGSTVVTQSSEESSGYISGGFGSGGLRSTSAPTVVNATTVMTAQTSETSGVASGGFGSGGVLSTKGNLTWTKSNATTITLTQVSETSGIASGGSGTGGIITPSTGINGTAKTTVLRYTVATTLLSGATSGETSGASASGEVSSPSESTPFSATTETGARSGQGSPPGTTLSGTAPTTVSYSIPGWNYTTSLPTGTVPTSETLSAPETTPSVPSSGLSIPTTTELPKSGQQSPSGNSSGFPTPSPNSTWLGETHLASSSITTSTGYGYPPPLNYTQLPETTTSTAAAGSSGFPIPISNNSWSGSTAEGPRSGHQSPPGSSSFPTPSPNTTWLGETRPAPTTTLTGSPTPTSIVNDTGSSCATITRETVTQTIYTSGTPGCVCASTSLAGFPWGGYGVLFGGGASPSLETTSTPITSATRSSTTPSLDQVRRPNTTATPDQVAWACNNIGNQIFNGGFELVDDNSEPLGWGFETSTTDILPPTFNSTIDSSQLTPGGSREGTIITYDTTSVGDVLQPLTLCPNSTYSFGAYTKVARVLAECTATFIINSEVIGIVSPSGQWGNGISNLIDFTPDAPEADLQISVQCIGSGDAMGRRVLDLDEISLTIKTTSP
jgi:hypothetical protein